MRGQLFLQHRFSQPLLQIVNDLLDDGYIRPRENKQIPWPFAGCLKNHNILRKKTRLTTNVRASEIDSPRELASYKNDLARFSFCGDQRAEKICRNPTSAAANTGRGPGNRFTEKRQPSDRR